nr:MAG TPA: hypothetical protein [Caudoviricetes sp.]
MIYGPFLRWIGKECKFPCRDVGFADALLWAGGMV